MKKTKLFFNVCVVILLIAGFHGVMAAGAKEEEEKELTLLTWNISFYEENIMGWIEDFEKENPGVTVKWLDKKGSEFDTFFMTQLAAGDPPDIIDIQGPLFAKYADMGALKDLGDWLANDPDVKGRYNENVINSVFKFEGKTYEVPFYFSPSVLYYNKLMFEEAGIDGPPETIEELLGYAKLMAKDEKSGFMTLNFDWMYWPLFKANGVELLTPDNRKAAFNTPAAVETLETLAKFTKNGVISKLSWTARWKELNDSFGAGIIGMFNSNGSSYHNIAKAGADWVSPETVGITSFPGRWNVPGQHGLAMSSLCKYPEEAWELMKVITNKKWSEVFIKRTSIFTGNNEVDNWFLTQPDVKEDPLKYQLLKTQLSNMDRLTGSPALAQNERIKEVFFTAIQEVILGDTSAKAALDSAEKEVNKILSE